jgi:hypothetical protein
MKNKRNLQLNKRNYILFPILYEVHCSASKVNKTEYVDPLGH